MKNVGGGLTRSIKSLTGKVETNPYFQYWEGRGQENVEFFHIPSVFNFRPLPL